MKNGTLQKLHKKIQTLRANETAQYIYLICLILLGILAVTQAWTYRTGFEAGLAQGKAMYQCANLSWQFI